MEDVARRAVNAPLVLFGPSAGFAKGRPAADSGPPGLNGASLLEKDTCVLLLGQPQPLMASLAEQFQEQPGLSVLGVARTSGEAVDMLSARSADLVLIDGDAGGDGQFDAAREIRAVRPHIHIVLLCDDLQDAIIEQALVVGVRGLVPKHHPPSTILTAIHEVLAGGFWFPEEVRSRIVVDATGVRLAPPDSVPHP